jgi:hypothetical protein
MPISDPTSARILVYNVVVSWVAKKVNTTPSNIDVSRTFVDNPGDGYGFDEGGYLKMCDEIAVTISTASGRPFNLPGTWRLQNENDTIGDFINAAALRLIAAPLSPAGVKAHAWMMKSAVQPWLALRQPAPRATSH